VGWSGRHRTDGLTSVDITDKHAVAAAFAAFVPRVCIHCAAFVDVDRCERERDLATRVNVRGTQNLVEAATRFGTRLVFISTDYVFDGRSTHSYTESAAPHPLQVYGQTKLAAERFVQASDRNLVIRLPLLYRHWSVDAGWFGSAYRSLASRRPVEADPHDVRQPSLVDDVAKLVAALASSDGNGIVHMAPSEGITKYQWARLIAKALRVPQELVTPKRRRGTADRPRQASLQTQRRDEFGFPPPRSVREVLADSSFLAADFPRLADHS
jgi:dTDP-4-dehydrorhamnose reductase